MTTYETKDMHIWPSSSNKTTLRSEATDGLNYRRRGSQGSLAKTPKAGLLSRGVNVAMWWHPRYICTSCLRHDCLSFWRQTSHHNSTIHVARIHYRLSSRQRCFIAPRQPRILLIMYRDSMVSLLNVVEDNCTLKWMSEAGNVSAHY